MLPVSKEETAPFMDRASWVRSLSFTVFTLRLFSKLQLSLCKIMLLFFFVVSFLVWHLLAFYRDGNRLCNVKQYLLYSM